MGETHKAVIIHNPALESPVRPAWCFDGKEEGAPATMAFPPGGTEQDLGRRIGLNSIKTNRAETLQVEEQACGSRSQPASG